MPDAGCRAAEVVMVDFKGSQFPKAVILDLSRFNAAPSARLSHLAFEGDMAFPAQC